MKRSEQCCLCVDIHSGIYSLLALSMFSAPFKSSFYSSDTSVIILVALMSILFYAVAIYFVIKQNITGYRVFLLIHSIIYGLLVLAFVVTVVLLARTKRQDISFKAVFTTIVLGVLILLEAYFMFVFWQYRRVMYPKPIAPKEDDISDVEQSINQLDDTTTDQASVKETVTQNRSVSMLDGLIDILRKKPKRPVSSA